MANGKIYLRKASIEDCDLLFEWANDEVTRANSFNTDKIEYESHVKWFEALINNKHRAQYILMIDENPIGQVRFDIDGDVAEIGYSIQKSSRGKGYGKLIIELAVSMLKNEFPNIEKIVAKVKVENISSSKCFFNNNFQQDYIQYSLDV
ncbi:Protein N-acetyltransferase, RimJ/RimL family [Pseudobutyrivibrio sp. YE44]|uniref:GNAT family N-acetyltransferase n=1 Tax=Pseudobutyrivibrio sp. YE44 TaxID=1520802 RepID=UPI000881CC62|nr:GNAT family N-acetyltransferase [Pseudobutyrivibrio sp. YE44]SDB54195.1 Protein N-acetyltransferase, RimJ/RimL family [Pseudobutyrivibrio sp. YE44]